MSETLSCAEQRTGSGRKQGVLLCSTSQRLRTKYVIRAYKRRPNTVEQPSLRRASETDPCPRK